jgi:MFS family permease
MTSEPLSPNLRRGPFLGWIVVGGAFAVMFVGFGATYTFSAFFEPLAHEFGASRAEISLVFSLAGFVYFLLGAVSGPLADRFGARPIATLGILALAAGLFAASRATTLTEVFVGYGLGVGIGVGFSYVPAVAAVQRWFTVRRGLASGIAVSGIGLGTLAMPPLAAWLIAEFAWREAYALIAIGVSVVGLAAALLLESDPAKRGLRTEPTAAGSSAVAGATVRQAIATRPFQLLYAGCLLCAIGLFVPFVHIVPYAEDHGVPRATAVFLVGLIGIGSTAGRFVLGGVADRLGRRLTLAVMFAGMGVSLLVWLAAEGALGLALFALAFGLFYGGFVALLPALMMDHYGGRHVSGIIGTLYTSVGFGTLAGPVLAGYAFDVSHSYTLPILASAAANLLGGICILAMPDAKGAGKV